MSNVDFIHEKVDTITRKFDVKDLYFEDDKLMTVIKDEDPQEVNLIEDLKSLFGDNIFNLAATMKSESEIDIEEEN